MDFIQIAKNSLWNPLESSVTLAIYNLELSNKVDNKTAIKGCHKWLIKL